MIRLILGLILAMGAMEAEALTHIILFGLLGLAIMAWGVQTLNENDRRSKT